MVEIGVGFAERRQRGASASHLLLQSASAVGETIDHDGGNP